MAGARPAGRMPFMPDPTLNRLRPALRACHHLEQGGFDWFGLVVFSLEASSEISSLACATLLSETRAAYFLYSV
jgi:hypothetical protein